MEFFERLNKTAFANAKQSSRNSYFCLFMQYLPSDFAISQISFEVLLRFAKIMISHRRYCVFQTPVLEALWKLWTLKMQYLLDEMLDFPWICNTSNAKRAILTCQASLRGPCPRTNGDTSQVVVQILRFCRPLIRTPSDVIRRSIGLPWGGLLNT